MTSKVSILSAEWCFFRRYGIVKKCLFLLICPYLFSVPLMSRHTDNNKLLDKINIF